MGRKPEPEKAANHERWLVSYADFMTLLFAFFVVMFASSQADTERTKRVQTSMQKAFSNFGFFETGSGSTPIITQSNLPPSSSNPLGVIIMPPAPDAPPTASEGGASEDTNPWEKPTGIDQPGVTGTPTPTPKPTPTPTPTPTPLESTPKAANQQPGDTQGGTHEETLFKELQQVLKIELQSQKIEMREEKRGIVISLRDVGFFDSGSATLKPESRPILAQIGSRLFQIVQEKGPKVSIRIEGHTDDVPLSPENAQRFGDNFGLSTERANAVVRNLISINRFPPQTLVASGYGSWRPIDKNNSPEGKAHNRRVDIVILNEEYSGLEAPVLTH